jgi:BASS family bile acid:Na+ symporter
LKPLYWIDDFISKHMLSLTLVCMVVGVIFCDYLGWVGSSTRYLFAFLTLVSSLGASFTQMKLVFLRPKPILLSLALLHVIIPVLALLSGKLFFPDEPLFITGMVLSYAVPSAVFALFWTSISRGSAPVSLAIVLISTLCSPVVIPATLKLLAGSMTKVDATGIMTDLLFMVALPALAALLAYHFAGEKRVQNWKTHLSPFSKICMVLILLSNASNVAPFVRNMTPLLWLIMGVVFVLSILSFFLAWLMARLIRADFPTTLSMVLTGGMRNISAGAVLASQYFPAEVMYPVMISCLFLQIMASAVVRILRATPAGRADQAAFEAAQESAAIPAGQTP